MIREAIADDYINLAALSLGVWLNTYCKDGIRTESSKYAISLFTKEYFNHLLNDSKYRILVFVDDIYLRGYTLVNLESFYKDRTNGFEIDKLYVHEQYQGKGIGRSLISEIKKQYGNNFWLHTSVKNESIKFYKNLGFTDIGQYSFEFEGSLIENRVLAFNNRLTT